MALDAHIAVKGDVQSDFPGCTLKAGRDGTTEVWAFNHELKSPRDEASGAPSGKRQHKPMTITKAVDASSPYYVNALCSNENLPMVKLDFYHANPKTGKENNFFSIELMNATVSNIRSEQLNNKYLENGKHELREHISFTYQAITWTNNEKNAMAHDDWLGNNID